MVRMSLRLGFQIRKSRQSFRSFNSFAWSSHAKALELAETPPSSWYTKSIFFQSVEKPITFSQNWLCVGVTDSIPKEEGGFFATTILDEPILLVRQRKGNLKAFFNVCRHHAAKLLDDGYGVLDSDRKRIVCPYHGWQYTCEGRLAKATHMKGIKNFTPKENGLVHVACEIIDDRWIMVNLSHEVENYASSCIYADSGAGGISSDGTTRYIDDDQGKEGDNSFFGSQPDMREFFGLLRQSGANDLVKVGSRRYSLQCNWKVFVDNYLDGGYHVSYAHPGLASNLDLDAYHRSSSDNFFLQSCAKKDGESADGRFSQAGSDAIYLFHHPNFMVNRYGDWMDTNTVWPTGVDSCIIDFDWFARREIAQDKAQVEAALSASDLVQEEDEALCLRVQAGLRSKGYRAGRYAPTLEEGEFCFHKKLYRDLQSSSLYQ
jgi:choline monooxygenase